MTREFEITGGKIQIKDVDKFINKLSKKDFPIQVIKADLIAGEDHLKFSIQKAKKSMKKNPISDSLSIEILLYVLGERQINKAIEKAGIKKGKNEVALIYPKKIDKKQLFQEIGLKPKQNLLKYKETKIPRIKKAYDITQKEIEAVGKQKIPKLVKERVALLELKK